jgi:hypothetical protein
VRNGQISPLCVNKGLGGSKKMPELHGDRLEWGKCNLEKEGRN